MATDINNISDIIAVIEPLQDNERTIDPVSGYDIYKLLSSV